MSRTPALAGGQREVDGGGCGESAGGVVASGTYRRREINIFEVI
ncbi:MAG: hypothetical protein O8C66_15595 [Candidatus Methanoperedens sp.]|nr:hypothetical protein [Candidatus Methanoperedens sp.]MCZ7371921.1 hypothetical protein [Candidatus Methanoperedens sp.]